MCEPISTTIALASIAASAYSAKQQQKGQQAQIDSQARAQNMQTNAQNEQINAQLKIQNEQRQQYMAARAQERVRQNKLSEESQASLADSIARNNRQNQQVVQEAQQAALEQRYLPIASAAVSTAAIPGAAKQDGGTENKVIADSYKTAFTGIGNSLKNQAKAQAALDATGNLAQVTGFGNSKAIQNQGILSNFMTNSSGLADNQLSSINNNAKLDASVANTNSELDMAKAATAANPNAGQSNFNKAALFGALGNAGLNYSAGQLGGVLGKKAKV
jgi:hypothetical protein